MAAGDIDNDQSEWFIAGPGNKPYGPYPFSKLIQYVADGRLRRDSLVHQRGTDSWVPAAEVSGLFRAARVAPQMKVVREVIKEKPSEPVISCPTCSTGRLSRVRLYRMSDPAVWIGYILLVPSFIGMGCAVVATGFVVIEPIVRIIVKVMTGEGTVGPSNEGVVPGVYPGVCLFISCFVSGIFGWLLVMKKSVLRCNLCGMTIDAA